MQLDYLREGSMLVPGYSRSRSGSSHSPCAANPRTCVCVCVCVCVENQIIKRFEGNQDDGLVQQVFTRCRSLRLQSRQVVRVLLCEDGKRGGPSSVESVRQGVECSYNVWKTPATVEFVAFSFLSQD